MTHGSPEKDLNICCHMTFNKDAKALCGRQNISPPKISMS